MRLILALPGGSDSLERELEAEGAKTTNMGPFEPASPPPQRAPVRTRSQLNLVIPPPETPVEPTDAAAEAPKDFARRSLCGRDFSNEVLDGADFRGADLDGASFVGASLVGARFDEANLEGADFFGATLARATLTRVDANRANFGGATLDDVDAAGANFADAVFSHANLNRANLQDACLSNARLQHCSLAGASLSSAVATNADFTWCVLTNANFEWVQIEGAIFRSIHRYRGSSFYGCDLSAANWAGSLLFRRHSADENYIRELRERSAWARAGVFVWWATSDCGRSMGRWGAWTALIAIAYAFAYTVVGVNFGANETPLSPLYFSIVTLTSLGYGDVLPTTMAGQAVAMSESMVGFGAIGGLISIFTNKVARRAD